MDELITWLRTQIADDERKIAAMEREERRVQTAPIFQGHPPNWLAGVDIFVSSKRWRAEVEAKRRILDLHDRDHECSTYGHDGEVDNCTWVIEGDACSTVRLLAAPYAGRPGWRTEWAA